MGRKLVCAFKQFGPLVDWLTGLLAGWPEGQMDKWTEGQLDRGTAGQGDRQATVCFSHMTHGGHKSCMWRMANECANNSIKNNKKRITSVPRVTARMSVCVCVPACDVVMTKNGVRWQRCSCCFRLWLWQWRPLRLLSDN